MGLAEQVSIQTLHDTAADVSRVQWVELRHVTRGDNITIYTQREIMSHAAEIESLME